MKAWQVWSLGGLLAGIAGAVVLSWVNRELFKASNQYDGIQSKDLRRVKWANRLGWLFIAVGFGAQAMSVLLTGD